MYKEISRISAPLMTQFEDIKEMPGGIYMPNILKRSNYYVVTSKLERKKKGFLEEQKKKWNRIASSHRAVPVSDRAQSTPASRHRDIHQVQTPSF
jgi:hypothetical protein